MLELNKIYNCDCLEGMKQIPDKYFELAIVTMLKTNYHPL
jgi:site-specific DNA-methyltransferase (adenine-specific)